MTSTPTESYTLDEAADRAGVPREYFELLVSSGILSSAADRFSAGDIRRATSARTLTDAGVPVETLAGAIARGTVSLEFLDSPVYERFAAVTRETFRDVSARTGLPLDIVKLIREVMGSPTPRPDDRVRETELEVLPFLQAIAKEGFSLAATERVLRVMGDSLRRVAATEADWYFGEVIAPRLAQGLTTVDIERETSPVLAAGLDRTLLAIYHGQQAHTWMRNIVRGIGSQLEDAGLHTRVERPPAICFLDVTGYTRLTQERGDAAAAELAERLSRLVQRTSFQHGGRPVKWLGDGVMFYFDNVAPSVVAALEMVAGVGEAGLPPA
ncbi:MAG TPA: adenylate cyclase regulatory domain-containing protein, partial [Vicinamibacterales bacterium]|nr:adenylate cyclase regulatory domain-containing protein [Vicinamibacterales bacterium]